MKLILLFSIMFIHKIILAGDYALDDVHNHDGTHVEGQMNCGENYMYPGALARLGSHSFLILGEDGPEHLLLDHRSGTPPHTYQFILKVRVDKNEMTTYRKLLKNSKRSLPAVTTIFYDKTGKQIDRTFFCLTDLNKIFGTEKNENDPYEKLFPIRSTWQLDADFEGAFPIEDTIVPQEDPLVIDRQDVEIVLYRYLPSYLEQEGFRNLLKSKGASLTSILSHAPIQQNDSKELAQNRNSYIRLGAFKSNGETCSSDYYLKKIRPPKTKHAFLLLAESGKNTVLASHLYDQSPQNYQTTLTFELTSEQMEVYRKARKDSKSALLFWPEQYFCMSEIRNLIKNQNLTLSGYLYQNTEYQEFQLGKSVGELSISSKNIKVLVNRALQSLMNPQAVARDVFQFVDMKTIEPTVHVESFYFSDVNFIGQKINGYEANKCLLTAQAAKALALVQKDLSANGYSLLMFDCYRPQKAVNQFVNWTKDLELSKMKSIYYPEVRKQDLIKKGYIDSKSGHSRGSTVDLTLVKTKDFKSEEFFNYSKKMTDCRKTNEVEKTGALDMGTSFDCFSELAHTLNPQITEQQKKNRLILKNAMEKHGFSNYSKEWWHFVFKEEPYKNDYFDFEIQ